MSDLNFYQIAKKYSDENEAYKFLESLRWENGIVCPHCNHIGAKFIPANKERKTRKGTIIFRRI